MAATITRTVGGITWTACATCAHAIPKRSVSDTCSVAGAQGSNTPRCGCTSEAHRR